MTMGSFYFKLKAKEALKGNWQTAMVITFFSGIFLTAGQVFQALYMPVYFNPYGEQMMFFMPQMSPGKWAVFAALSLLAVLFTPVLDISCDHYFVKRHQHEELGTAGLWCRINCFGKALWLYVIMGVRIFLWGLLLVVPGVIAAIRYSLAPYYLAENPDMTASEAIEASKTAMADQKMNFFMLMLSFIGWALLSDAVQLGLMSVSGIVATAAGLFFQVWIGAYTNATVASFYLTVSEGDGLERARREMQGIAREMGMSDTPWDQPLQRPSTEDDGTQQPADKPADDAPNAAEPPQDGGSAPDDPAGGESPQEDGGGTP